MRDHLTSSEGLPRAIRQLYATFARYPLKTIVGCECCTDERDLERLRAAPLRQLSADDLAHFASSSILTLGDVDDLRHFLPRILEIVAADGEVGFVDPEIVLAHLRYGHWTDWPADERDAVRTFLAAWWNDALATHPGLITADDAICSLAQAEDDVRPYLAAWKTRSDLPAMRHLADFVISNVGAPARRKRESATWKLGNAFWQERRPQMEQVLSWVLSTTTQKQLEDAFFAAGSPEDASVLSLAGDYVAYALQLRAI